ncbi:Proline-rich receptor-like protein kinase PERK9 [Apostasia shenzhenica]|uniref:Proline-rich receptor-like protein kinase PERK9 n=1 Tax=Apostasia shenzhenica TaxID=1088818 RepID=A0A2I0AVQ1_9ASPA|nr:Proline-rich receptor-like protein kinase PERK9 [Apostasia shenzhenica]
MVAEKGGGRCIVVGLQINSDGRDLLSWALTQIAGEGDRVVAVHVCRDQVCCKTPNHSLIKVLDDCLADHEDLFTRKKFVLAGRISRENSIKKALVKEAQICAASAVIVGANKNSFWGSASLAKYCAKKLPPTTALIAVHNGQMIFERSAAKPPSGEEPKANLRSFLHPSVGMDAVFIAPSFTTRSDLVREEDKKQMVKVSMSSSAVSLLVRRLPVRKPGWPLLRRAATANIAALKESEARKMSVVQWAMKLPDRSSLTTQKQADLIKELEILLGVNSSSCRLFQFKELQKSTNYFSSENLIGKGGNSQVYRGCLLDHQKVAIKVSKFSEDSSRNFLLEVDIITRLRHEHVVPLIGICVQENKLISVYPYFSAGSLEENLQGKRAKASLAWDKRFKAAVGVAEALSYLHDGCSRPVIHRDVKSSNILLTDEFDSRISDFGLAMWAPTTSSYLTHSDVVGTFGYLAPEYFMYGKVSSKIDVYAFGVVLLELLSGRRPINDGSPKGLESLVIWATLIFDRGDIMELLDPKMEGKYNEDQMRRMVLASSLCIRREARRRPKMNQILGLLRGEERIPPLLCSSHASSNSEELQEEEEAHPASSIGSHLELALLDVEDDASVTSFEQNYVNSLDDYLVDRWSRSSSFD